MKECGGTEMVLTRVVVETRQGYREKPSNPAWGWLRLLNGLPSVGDIRCFEMAVIVQID